VHLLVVIDHRQARVYRTQAHRSVPQRITPYDPGGSGRHLHNVEQDSNGQRKPELKSFYKAVTKTLERAERILLFGAGTGASNAMEHVTKGTHMAKKVTPTYSYSEALEILSEETRCTRQAFDAAMRKAIPGFELRSPHRMSQAELRAVRKILQAP